MTMTTVSGPVPGVSSLPGSVEPWKGRISLRPFVRREAEEASVPLEHKSSERLHALGQLAASPATHELSDEGFTEFVIHAPGAKAANTEVVWDAQARRLAVAVWAPRRPKLGRPVPRSWALTWYKSLELLGHRPEETTVSVGRGRIRVRVPQH